MDNYDKSINAVLKYVKAAKKLNKAYEKVNNDSIMTSSGSALIAPVVIGKVFAIRLVRAVTRDKKTHTCMGLKEAKELVEAIGREYNIPELF
jgi:ribosomal protein L7/L12